MRWLSVLILAGFVNFMGQSGIAQDAARVAYLWVDGAERVTASGLLRPGARAARVSDRFAVASTGKAFLAVAVLQLHERGVLDIDDPAAKWLPENVSGAFGGLPGISIAHLLQMRSGLPDFYTDDYLDPVLEDPSKQTIGFALGLVADAPVLFKPGRRFDYSNTNYLLAELILQRASGLSMAKYFDKHIFGPAKLKKTFVFGSRTLPNDFVSGTENLGSGPRDVSFYYQGQGFGDGPLISTAEDMAAFYRALFVDRILLSKPALTLMLTDVLGENYGMGIEIETLRGVGPVYGHSGGDLGFTADIRYAVELDAIAVVLLAEPNGNTAASYEMLRSLNR